MKELIRNILKEEFENPNLEKEGIDLAIKILKKTYPFVVGWKYNKQSETNAFYHVLDLICDIEKTEKFFESDIKSYYKRNLEKIKEDEFAYPFSILQIAENLDSDQKFKIFSEIRKELQDIYEMLPEKFFTMTRFNQPKELDLDKFVFV